ncbi:MAG: four helix bundle protein [Paludibacteraceae bacterium]|nr:four helix bundle protein [Paludibacteraceae bacterium]
MKDFKTQAIWQRSHKLTLDIYRATQNFPKEEMYGLTSQIRRAVSSIPTNIAEGCGRRTNAELSNFLNIASGSASEVEYEIILAREVGYITKEQCELWTNEIGEIRSMIAAYMKKLNTEY